MYNRVTNEECMGFIEINTNKHDNSGSICELPEMVVSVVDSNSISLGNDGKAIDDC